MAIVMSPLTNCQILNDEAQFGASDANVSALIQFGDGGVGAAYGVPGPDEYQIDSFDGTSSPTYGIWSTNYVNGVTPNMDSGWVNVSFSVNAATGAESLYVGIGNGSTNNAPTTYDDDPMGSIGEVDVVTGAFPNAGFIWRNLDITFSKNGQQVSSWTDTSNGGGADISVDQTQNPGNGPQVVGISVQPGTSADSMTLTGGVRLVANGNADFNNPMLMFSQIFVKPGNS